MNLACLPYRALFKLQNNSATIFLQINIDVVELDPVMKEIAVNYFDFVEDDRQRCIIADGVDFIRQAAIDGSIFVSLCCKFLLSFSKIDESGLQMFAPTS